MKRLIGLPGETVEVRLLRGDGYVFINGKRLKEPYIAEEPAWPCAELRAGEGPKPGTTS